MERFYAIRSKKTGKLVTGTDYRKPRGGFYTQLYDPDLPPLLFTGLNLDHQLRHRGISLKTHEVVQIRAYVEYPLRNREITEHCEEYRKEMFRRYGKRNRTG